MLLKLIKLPLRLAAIPILLALLALQLLSAVVIGLSSIITHLLASVFLIGAVAGWLAQAQSWMLWQAVGIGLFFAVAPSLAAWLLNVVTDCVLRILSFVLSKPLILLPCASSGNHPSIIGNPHVWR